MLQNVIEFVTIFIVAISDPPPRGIHPFFLVRQTRAQFLLSPNESLLMRVGEGEWNTKVEAKRHETHVNGYSMCVRVYRKRNSGQMVLRFESSDRLVHGTHRQHFVVHLRYPRVPFIIGREHENFVGVVATELEGPCTLVQPFRCAETFSPVCLYERDCKRVNEREA